jgi:hypothetical protein
MKRRLSGLALSLAVALSAARNAAAAPDDLHAAFRTAFGSGAVRHVLQSAHPPGQPKGDNYREGPVDLTLKPALLAPLGGDRYALVVSETNIVGAHVDPGAIAVAYLRRSGQRWTVEKSWPEFIWAGNTGHPADAIEVLAGSKPPLVTLASEYMAQGQGVTTTGIVRLGAAGPEFLGIVPSGGRMDAEDACTGCKPYEYTGTIGPPRRAGDVLSVTYVGREATGRGGWRPIHGMTDYRSRAGVLAPTSRVVLPWLTIGAE